MQLITLLENKRQDNRLKCEHGLSFILRVNNKTILFDAGQSDKMLYNAEQLAVEMNEVDYVVLSHGHYDHSGGVPAFLELNTKAVIYVHPGAFKERFSRSSAMVKENGIAWRNDLKKYESRIKYITELTELTNGVWVLPNIKQQPGYEVENERLVVKEKDGYVPDVFADELILVAKEHNDPVVLCGCSHNGIVNILHHVKQLLGFDSFQAVSGGLHLRGKADKEINHVISGVKPFNVGKWALNHCTGNEAFEAFSSAYVNKVEYSAGGHVIDLE